MGIIEELELRGVLHDKTSDISAFSQNNSISIYCGIDPTSDSLHIGHLVPLITLIRLKKVGINNIFLLIGGATGMIGDPSFKLNERAFLDSETIKKNIISITEQIKKIFDRESVNIKVVNNFDWYSRMSVIDFLREGKYITVNYMSSKDSVKRRIVDGISFTEFSYQLLQAYDFYYLNDKFGVNVQIGGADQWGNITTGIDFIRKKSGAQVHGFTIKLLVKSDGTKFGKTENGAVWLDKSKTSSYDFFQFWINISDEDVINFIKIFSFKDLKELEELISEHKKCPKKRILQSELAREMTEFIHGREELEKCENISSVLFGNNDFNSLISIEGVDEMLRNLENVVVDRTDLVNCNNYFEFLCLSALNFFGSKSEIKKACINKSIYINKKNIESIDVVFDKSILSNKFVLVQKGKKNHFIVFLK